MAVLKITEIVNKLEAEAKDRKLNNLKKGHKPPIPSRDGIGDHREADHEGAEPIGSPGSEQVSPKSTRHATSTTAKLGKLADVSEKTMERAKFVRKHGTPEDVTEVESGEKTVNRKAREIRERQKGNTKSGTKKDPKQSKEHRASTEGELIAAEWRTWVQTLKHTLILNASSLPPGEDTDRVARFQRALQNKLVGKKARQQMKTALTGLIERCQTVLRQLA
jgi:hypothetical protein